MSRDIAEQLSQLSSITHQIGPDASWVSDQRSTMIARIQGTADLSVSASSASIGEKILSFFTLFVPKQFTFAARPFMIVFLSFAVILGSWGVRVASANSLPGEFLYSVKRADEYAQIALTTDTTKKVKKHLEFASRRNDEIAVIKQKKQENPNEVNSEDSVKHIEESVSSLEENIVSAEKQVRVLDGGSSENVLDVAVQFRDTVKDISSELSKNVGDIIAVVDLQDAHGGTMGEKTKALAEKVEQVSLFVEHADTNVIDQVVTKALSDTPETFSGEESKNIILDLVKSKAASVVEQVQERNIKRELASSTVDGILTNGFGETSSTISLIGMHIGDSTTTVSLSTSSLPLTTSTVPINTTPTVTNNEASDVVKKVVQEVGLLAENDLRGALNKVKAIQEGTETLDHFVGEVDLKSSETSTSSGESLP